MMNKKFECIPLQWDTDYFGVKSARVNLNGIVNKTEQDEIIAFCDNFDFVTISNANNLVENNQWIGTRTNAFLVDVNIQFVKELGETSKANNKKVFVTNNMPKNEQVIDIARRSFRYSRFFNDPFLDQNKANNIYTQWTENSFNREDKYFVIYEDEGIVMGYVIFTLMQDKSVIELIAVDEKYQGKRVGKSLIDLMELFVRTKNINKIKVGTQIINISAVKFYAKLQFEYLVCGSIYHYWPKSRIERNRVR